MITHSLDNVPAEMREKRRWIRWRYDNGTKVPYRCDCEIRASSTNPETWSTFEHAAEAAQRNGMAGPGYVIDAEAGEIVIDLDGCIDEHGVCEEWAAEILERFNTYAETSPSGHGVKIYCRGELPKMTTTAAKGKDPIFAGRDHYGIDLFRGARYLCITGQKYPGSTDDLRDCQPALDWLWEKYFAESGKKKNEQQLPPPSSGNITGTGDRPGDDYNRRGDVRELLIKHGWKSAGVQGDSEKWTRPGKDGGNSGSLKDGAFWCYTTSTHLEAEKAYSPFALLAALEFNGDLSIAAKWLRQQGYGADEPDISRIVNGQPACASLDIDPAKPMEKSALPKIVTYTPRGDDEPAPKLRKPVINGIAREGETINIIAPPKIGKSWAVLDLAFSVSTGAGFLNTPEFRTTLGNVLIVDNELHEETLEHRIATVQRSGRFKLGGHKRIDYVSLRGKLANILQLDELFASIDPDEYKLIIIDALYRVLPEGTDENDNGGMARIYNLIDKNAMRLNCVFAIIHHTSKGGQGSKAVTDVGSGAGSQSRATDAHLILRHHEEEGAMVLDAACRSFAPITPHAYRWQYPLWIPAPDLDATKLKVDRPKGKQAGGELSTADLDAKSRKVIAALRKKSPQAKTTLRDRIGMNGATLAQVLDHLVERGEVRELPGSREGQIVFAIAEDYQPDNRTEPDSPKVSGGMVTGRTNPLGVVRSDHPPGACSVLADWNRLSGQEEEFPQ